MEIKAVCLPKYCHLVGTDIEHNASMCGNQRVYRTKAWFSKVRRKYLGIR